MVREGKSVVWTGTSLETLRAFPAPARRAVGHELMRVQQGLMPTDWKAMSDIGHGVYEIRVHVGLEVRLLYVAKFAEAIYVLHAFGKKTRKTASGDLDIARRRFADLVRDRSR